MALNNLSNPTYTGIDWASDLVADWAINVVDKPIMEVLFPQQTSDPVIERLNDLERKIDLMIAMMGQYTVDIPTPKEIKEYGGKE